VRLAVAAEEIQPGDPLPSVRQLTASLRVNPATVVQAYRDLAAEGFVSMRHGAGTFVEEVPAQLRNDEMGEQARKLMSEAARLGIAGDTLRDAILSELHNAPNE